MLLAGCSAGMSGSDAGGVSSSRVEPGAPELAPDVFDEERSGDAAVESRDVITTGYLRVVADDPIDAADDAASVVDGAGGRIDSRNEQPGTEYERPSASLALRIPAAQYERVVAQLEELGEVASYTTDASDVTQQRRDLDARIEALRTSVERLLELLSDATTTSDLVAIESELTSRQAELDSLVSQRDWLADQVDYSTLQLELVAPGVVPEAGPGDFWSGLAAGWGALVAFASWGLVALGVLLPWIGLLAVIGAIVVLVVWLATRGARRRRSGGDAAGNGAPPRA